MSDSSKIGCVLLASGKSSRFGSNKLNQIFHGKSLLCRALDAIPAQSFEQVVVVTQYPDFSKAIRQYHFTEILNSSVDSGQSYSMKLGLNALKTCDGVVFLVADQPLLRRESISQLIDFWQTQPEKIAALAHQGKRGNPCLFPSRFFPELMEIRGDRGGSAVIRRHPEDLILLEVPEKELLDVDTVDSLRKLQQL